MAARRTLQGGGGEGQRQAFDDGLFALERDHGAVVDAAAQAKRPPAVEAELVHKLPLVQGRHAAHGVQPEAVQAVAHLAGNRQPINGVRRQEARRVGGDDGYVRAADACRDKGGELAVRHADARFQVLRHGAEQRLQQLCLAAVQLLQAVQPHVHDARRRCLDAVADRREAVHDPAEHFAVVERVSLRQDTLGLGLQMRNDDTSDAHNTPPVVDYRPSWETGAGS